MQVFGINIAVVNLCKTDTGILHRSVLPPLNTYCHIMPTAPAQKYFDEAEAYRENGFQEKAIEFYKKAIEIDPHFSGAHYTLALLYHKAHQFDNALIHLKKVIELDPGDASALNNIGVILYANNALNEAQFYFQKALVLERNYKEAQDNLKKVHEKLKSNVPFPLLQQTPIHHCHKIGFVSLWYERGQAYVTKTIRDALDYDYTTFILARNGGTFDKPLLRTTGEWETANLTAYPEYKIPHEIFKNWVVHNNLDVVFFNEEYDLGLVEIAKQCGLKTAGYYVWELFDPQLATACKRLYDKIICPTHACYEKFKKLGMDNIVYVQWGIDLNLFKPIEKQGNKPVRFFHPAGWGGLHARRGTQFVIDAFQRLNDVNAELLIHTQNGSGIQQRNNVRIISGTVPRKEIITMYQNSDVAVLPSKWEGLGLTFLESIGCALPVITVDASPMNEFVRNGETGFLCRVAERKNYQGIFIEGVHVDVDDMAQKMRDMARNNALRRKMSEKIYSSVRMQWDIENFRREINKILKNILQSSSRQNSVLEKTNNDAAPTFISVTGSASKLKLMSKDYAGCQLVRQEDGRQFIRKDNYEEPLVIHLVGARWSNHPWGMENEIHRALEKHGVTIIDTDFRRDFDRLPGLFSREAHVMLVIKGNGIPPELISKLPYKTILWYQDDVFSTDHAPQHISHNGWAFDTVYSFDEMALERYRELGVRDPRYLPLAMSPEVHRKMFLVKKEHDICFIGNVYPNRKALINRLAKRFNLFVGRAFMDDMVKRFNESKIVLNLGIGQTGIQQRVFEAMGCGSLVFTNCIPEESKLFRDRIQLVYFHDANIEELAEYYLSHEEERETIALAGYREVNSRHTFHHRLQKIFNDVFQDGCSVHTINKAKHAAHSSGIRTSSHPTLSVIIATYNRKSHLQRCIESLLRNSEQNIEIIVVDDPCSDGTREWLDEMKTKHPNITTIHNQCHTGQHRSMNRGFHLSHGIYIGFVNDDIEVMDGWDTALVSLLKKDPSYGTATPLIITADGCIRSMGIIDKILSKKYPQLKPIPGTKGYFTKKLEPDQIPESKHIREVEYGYYWVMKREVWEKIGGIDESFGKYCADADFGMRVRIAGYKNMYCPASVIIDHGADAEAAETTKEFLKKSQKLFCRKWDAYVENTNSASPEIKRYKILVVYAFDKNTFHQTIQNAVDRLSRHEHTVFHVVSTDLTARMDADVMNHLLVEGTSEFRPDIVLLLGGRDIYPHTLRKIKKTLHPVIMQWWHPDMAENNDEMPEWAVTLNGETDVCFISGASLDYVKIAETKGVRRGFWLESEESLASEIFSVLNGDTHDRMTLYHDEIKQFTNSTSDRVLLGQAKYLHNRGVGIITLPYLKKIIYHDPKCLDAYLLLSDYYSGQGSPREARDILQSALKVPLRSHEIDRRMGEACLNLGDVNEAERHLRVSLERHRQSPGIYNSMGQIFIQKGDLVEAERWLSLGVKEHPDNSAGLVLLGKLYRKQGRNDESISCFLRCLLIDHRHDFKDEVRNNLEDLYSIKKVDYDTSKILLSVFMLNFNRAEYMARSLYQFGKQTFPRQAFEILIIDSSTDNSREIIRSAVQKYGLNVRYFFIPQEGPGPNAGWFNFAVKQSRGDVVLWTHPEVLFSERMLEEFYKPHVWENKLWVSARMGVVLTKEDQEKIDKIWHEDIERILTHSYVRKESTRLGYKFWLPLLASFRKDGFLRIGGFIENLPVPRHDDLDLMFRLLAVGYSIHNPPGFQGIHQWHAPMEERGKDILSLMDKTRQIVYDWRKAFLRGELSAERYAQRNEGKEIGVIPDIKEESLF